MTTPARDFLAANAGKLDDLRAAGFTVPVGRPVAVELSAPRSDALTLEFLALWRAAGGPELHPEHEFHPARKWRFDFAILAPRVAIEIEGLVHGGKGRHQTVKGAREDAEKYLQAWLYGWVLIRLTRGQITPDHVKAIVAKLAREGSNE